MESPLYATTAKINGNKISPTSGNVNYIDKMSSSMNSSSTLDDTTPSDSGIQVLDSESSELMVESITSQSGLEFEDLLKSSSVPSQITDMIQTNVTVVDNNSNVAPVGIEDETMTTSACSTFDTTENIVYRRKVRKANAAPKAPKKRVSFHEDILKNTRTDNIHIEHGFITYKNGRKLTTQIGASGAAGRYSWCSERERERVPTELCTNIGDSEDTDECAAGGGRRRLVYRNACSDVLDYGNADLYDTNEQICLQYDNSGVFEYMPQADGGDAVIEQNIMHAKSIKEGQLLYRCSCSSSNSSLDSDEQDKNSNRQQYGQAKSSSCDCIGMSNNANNNFIGENCYFSEPNIENLNEANQKKSVWNKEKKPKSSCLKKTKCHTNIIQEQDLTTKVKKFNVHDIKNQLLDNSSKMIFGSLKSIFTIPLPERGVPEGSEDLQAVIECVPELEQTPEHTPKVTERSEQDFSPESPPLKAKPFLSKSLDGSKQTQNVKKFVHNVDEQLRRRKDETLFIPSRQTSDEPSDNESNTKKATLQRQQEFDDINAAQQHLTDVASTTTIIAAQQPMAQTEFRNKFIINCESTVFEHTGVSYETNFCLPDMQGSVASLLDKDTPIAQPANQARGTFMSAPIAKTFSNFFRSFKDTATAQDKKLADKREEKQRQKQTQNDTVTENYFATKLQNTTSAATTPNAENETGITSKHSAINLPTPSSTISEIMSTTTNSSSSAAAEAAAKQKSHTSNNSLAIGQDMRNSLEKQSRHLPSPLKKRSSGGNLLLQTQPQRYGNDQQQHHSRSLHSPDLYSNLNGYMMTRTIVGSGRDSKSTILSEEFDDMLTVTTTTTTDLCIDKPDSDLVIVDYSELTDRQSLMSSSSTDFAHMLLKPPQPPAAKSSLINRFLRNVTQKKILESSIRKNNFFADKLRSEQKLLATNLYVPGVRPKNYELIDDLNAEIAMEIEMSGANSPRRELVGIDSDLPNDISRFEMGIGEISIDIFNGKYLPMLRDEAEQLMKVFKLYTGYSNEGFMTPVLVFLTDKTLYVCDLVRNRLCAKFVLAYADLDVILMGPFGNTVLLSNSSRDMQQVLLAGGPYPADGLVANLELCARRGGSSLPAVGQLTLEHLASLQSFVRANSSVAKHDKWMYYAVVNVPAGALGVAGAVGEQEPLGPHIKGFLMHRRIKGTIAVAASNKINWNPGYFLLKAGVLYMFNDSSQKLPSWAMALAECQGARRTMKAARPHCFEILLKDQLLQLAAPDEYVASEWLQALLQSASGLFEMQEKHKALGCTLIVTEHHLITLREDFTAPLRKINKQDQLISAAVIMKNAQRDADDINMYLDAGSLISSTMSTPTRCTQRSCSSINSTPTKISQLSRSTITNTNSVTSNTPNANSHITFTKAQALQQQQQQPEKECYTAMSSVYGKNCGIEILTCADIKEMTGIKIPSHNDTWWCILEFSCQEAPLECSDDLAIFFASSSEMQRFLRLLEQLWQAKNNDLFPITILDEDELIAEQCTMLYMDINRAWEPLLTAALGYPL